MYKNFIKSGFAALIIIVFCMSSLVIPAAGALDTNYEPRIPQISTLPGPQDVSLSEANRYLRDEFLPNLAMIIIKFAIPVAVIFLIVGAIQFISAFGNSEKLALAKKTVTFALIGLVISLLAYSIVQLIFFGGYQITQIS